MTSKAKGWPPKVAKAIDEAVVFLAIMDALEEKFPPKDVWQDYGEEYNQFPLHRDGSEIWSMSARLVYAQIENHKTTLPRATKYIDICLDKETLVAQSSSRALIRVDYFAPGSLEKIEKFIAEHLDGTRKWR
jgi:hypothetical protein